MSKSAPSATYAIMGAAGYIAPRHLQAIKETGGALVAAFDPSDSVGILDRYFPDCRFFVEYERFDRHVDMMRREGQKLDYVSICSPNYLHDAHCRFALRSGADAICEKPLVLNPWNIDGLATIEKDTGRKINTILQLRLHPSIIALRDQIAASNARIHDVDLTYITSRGGWYYVSWKGDEQKSGGIATNIGVHFYDMLGFVFGRLKANIVHHRAMDCAAGYLEYERARVRWFLSINERDLPDEARAKGRTTHRSMTVDGSEFEFSEGFTDLHTQSYRSILEGKGFGLDDIRPSIEIVSHIRSAPIELGKGERHPFVARASAGNRYEGGWPTHS